MLGAIGAAIGGAFGGPAGAAIGGSIGGALDAGRASSRAASAASGAEREAARLQQQRFEQVRADLAPYRTGGLSAFNAVLSLAGLPGVGMGTPQATPARGGNVPAMRAAAQPLAGRIGASNLAGRRMSSFVSNLPAPSIAPGMEAPGNVLFPFENTVESQSNQDMGGGFLVRQYGGPVPAGMRALVGEAEPELAVSRFGTRVVGAEGPEFIQPSADTQIIPGPQTMASVAGPQNFAPVPGGNPAFNMTAAPAPVGQAPANPVQPISFYTSSGAVRENPGGTPGNYNFQADPGYQFRLSEGERAIERSASARGGLLSGATLRALTRYGQNFATGEFQNVYNRLAGIAQMGQQSAAQTGAYGIQSAAQQGQNIVGAGQAQAAGIIGRASAYGNALNDITGYFAPSFRTPGITP